MTDFRGLVALILSEEVRFLPVIVCAFADDVLKATFKEVPTHATKRAKRYRYYVSAPLLAGEGLRVSAGDIEALVLDRLRALLSSRTDVSETLAPLDLGPSS